MAVCGRAAGRGPGSGCDEDRSQAAAGPQPGRSPVAWPTDILQIKQAGGCVATCGGTRESRATREGGGPLRSRLKGAKCCGARLGLAPAMGWACRPAPPNRAWPLVVGTVPRGPLQQKVELRTALMFAFRWWIAGRRALKYRERGGGIISHSAAGLNRSITAHELNDHESATCRKL